MRSPSGIKLIVSEGPSPGQEYELNRVEIVIGRDAAVDLVIPSPAVSRRHARLLRREGEFVIEDLGSSNGTYLNGQRISGLASLNPGDRIGIGKSIVLVFHGPPSIPEPTKISEGEQPGSQSTVFQAEPAGPPQPGRPPVRQPEPSPPYPPAYPPNRAAQTMFGDDLEPAPNIPPQLLVTVSGGSPQSYTLNQYRLTIGRAEDNDIVIPSQIVSRHHAHLERVDGSYRLVVLPEASNPVYVEGRALAAPYRLKHADTLRIGSLDPGMMVTMVYQSPSEAIRAAQSIVFGDKNRLQIGRDPENDVILDAPNVSRYHATVERVGQRYRVLDLRSSNGTFVNDQRIDGEVWLKPEDSIRVGPYRFVLGEGQLSQYDESGGRQVIALGLNKWVRKDLNILKDISLIFQPREFIVVVGQSGGGKSTLVDAIAGYRPATHGKVLVNGIDVYRDFDAIRNDIGFVPQRDIIHMELTVYQALDYAAQLRMPPDTSKAERHKRVMEVLEDLDLAHRKEVQISGLSGGQQKRVSIGVELLTKPGLFFLDEPTSGLDPGTETALMQLMRRLADQGRTIILITHATKNVMLADKVVFLARGGYMAWFGPPNEALEYFNQFRSERDRRTGEMQFDEIYAVLDDPSKGSAEEWARRFRSHPAYQEYVARPLQANGVAARPGAPAPAGQALPNQPARPLQMKIPKRNQVSALRQFFILSARNIKILTRDRFSLIIMLAAAPLVGLLDVVLSLALGRDPFSPINGSFPNVLITLFLLTIYGVMVGGLAQMREFVKEGDIYKRERLVNLKLVPYVLSKIWVAALLALYQAAAYTLIHHLAFDMPGGLTEFLLVYITLALATMAGMMLGLFASALAPNANSAPLMVILLMLPQIVLGGALIPLPGFISAPTSTRWAFEAIMSIAGVGSDVAADVCWALPEELRLAMSIEDKGANGCRCMGLNVFNPESCRFPSLGQFNDPAIDQPAPQEPPPLDSPPVEPVIPDPPPEPADQSDTIAVAQYLEALKLYQTNVERIQNDYKAELDSYQAKADLYQAEMISYQESLAVWQIARSSAIGKAEGLINQFSKDFGWTFVNRADQAAYWSKILYTWAAQGLIILILFVMILFLMKRKDNA